jgi:hypothetical protein
MFRTRIVKSLRLLSFLVFIPFLSCGIRFSEKEKPVVMNGELDLSNWSFEKDGPLEFRGEWKFVWLESSPAFAATDFDDSSWPMYRVPGYWDRETKTSFGYAWFRARIRNISGTGLGIYLFTTHTAYELYVDGRKVMGNGKPGTTRENTTSERVPSFASLADHITIACTISNFDEMYGGTGKGSRTRKARRFRGKHLAR